MLAAQADNLSGGLTILLVVLGAVSISLIVLRRRQSHMASQRETPSQKVQRVKGAQRVREVADDLLVQLEQVAREVNARLDTKFARLERVVRDADQRIARLEQLLGHSPDAPAACSPSSEAPRPSRSAHDPQPRAAQRSPTAADPDARSAPARTSDATPQDAALVNPRHRRVYNMFDAGTAPFQIAEALDMPLSEVELILNLRELR